MVECVDNWIQKGFMLTILYCMRAHQDHGEKIVLSTNVVKLSISASQRESNHFLPYLGGSKAQKSILLSLFVS